MTRSPVVDVHTHMLTKEWLALLEQHGGRYTLKEVLGGLRAIHLDGSPFMTPVPNMFDWEARIANMNKARVDIAVTSLSCPNVFWGSPEVSLKAARVMNDDMAKAQQTWPDRIRWFASLPWQHEKLALEELARACGNGAVGVMVLANIGGQHLTDESFRKIWAEIDRRGLPVLVHPSAPPGSRELGMHEFQLTAPIGFTFDTSLAIARCIFDGFFDRFPSLKMIASHGGGALPFLVGRLDICWDNIPAARAKTAEPPRNYLRRVYADSVLFRQDALDMAVSVFGTDNVLYGSDYPHTIGDMAGCLSRVDALPGDVREKVRGFNAQR
ncbi:MAG TPA: amidohydrolase family protein, partial [Burkholderiales bacterium]|nr:amidohydrolase family protein [Burkholderiales bacterium]